MPFLRLPYLVELLLVHGAVGVEAKPRSGAHGFALLVVQGEELAQRFGAALPESNVESAQVFAGLLLILFRRRLAVGLEAAPLVEVKERPSQVVGAEALFERALSDLVGIEFSDLPAGFRIRRHEAAGGERIQQSAAPLQIAVAAAALAARYAPVYG